jgi:hypothetical protein
MTFWQNSARTRYWVSALNAHGHCAISFLHHLSVSAKVGGVSNRLGDVSTLTSETFLASMFATLAASILASLLACKLKSLDVGASMETSLTADQARTKLRKAIQAKFEKLVGDVRAAKGSLPDVADQIGVSGGGRWAIMAGPAGPHRR